MTDPGGDLPSPFTIPDDLRSPVPYFGGKAKVARLIWQALGPVVNFVDAFCGSARILLARPRSTWKSPAVPGIETLNDSNAFLTNAFRAIRAAPSEVARYARYPCSEIDLHARHEWLVRHPALREKMRRDPDWYDAKAAGWWLWGSSLWIGDGWCEAEPIEAGQLPRKLPRLDGYGGAGIVGEEASDLEAWLGAIARRIANVRIACGDFERVLGKTPLRAHRGNSMRGVVLDPPYTAAAGCQAGLYGERDQGTAARARQWALAHGDDPTLRIVLCGLEGEHAMPSSWREIAWVRKGGYASVNPANVNRYRERIWLSPACLPVDETCVPPRP